MTAAKKYGSRPPGQIVLLNSFQLIFVALFFCSCERKDSEISGENLSPTRKTNSPYERSFRESDLDQKIREIGGDTIDLSQAIVAQLLEKYPERRDYILQLYAKQLVESDPETALVFLAENLDSIIFAKDLGASITIQWLESDEGALRKHLVELFSEPHEGTVDTFLGDTILDFLIEPRQGQFDLHQWLSWIDTFESQEAIEHSALQSVLSEIHPQDAVEFTLVKDSYQERINEDEFQVYLPGFVELLTSVEPAEAKEFVLKMPFGKYREEAAKLMIGKLGKMDPEQAAEWLSADDFVSQILPPSEKEDHLDDSYDSFFDSLLSEYINSLVSEYPTDALDNIDSLSNPATRERVRKEINDRARLALQQQGLSLDDEVE